MPTGASTRPTACRHGAAARSGQSGQPAPDAAGGRGNADPTASRNGAARRKEPSMLIRSLRTRITRLVLVGAMTATVAVGSVAIGPSHEAAAMPRECATWESAADDYF